MTDETTEVAKAARAVDNAESNLSAAMRGLERARRIAHESLGGQAESLTVDNRHEDGLTVLVSIGNSDDRLTQHAWAVFYTEVDSLVRSVAEVVHGAWVSPSTQPYQNASWAFTGGARFNKPWGGPGGVREYLRDALMDLAVRYDQDSVAWLEAETEFLPGLA